MKVPPILRDILSLNFIDVEYSVNYWFQKEQERLNRKNERSQSNTESYKENPKFTEETLKRLYPIESKSEKINTTATIFEKVVKLHFNKKKVLSNDSDVLESTIKNLTTDEKEKNNLNFPQGDNYLISQIETFLSDDAVIDRIITMYAKICGYRCFHPRPLHDFWSYNLNNDDKYFRGIAKFDPDTLYLKLEEKYNAVNMEYNSDEHHEKEEKKSKNKFDPNSKSFKKLTEVPDRFKTGRQMLELKKKFKFDNILPKMIEQEFKDYRKFKFSSEYYKYDSDEEEKSLFRLSTMGLKVSKPATVETLYKFKYLVKKTRGHIGGTK